MTVRLIARCRFAASTLAAFAVLTALTACGGSDATEDADRGAAPATSRQAGEEPAAAERAAPTPPDRYFHDVTEVSGVDFVHNNGAFGERWLPETIGPGVVVFDADGDDRLDLLFVNGTRFEGRPGERGAQELFLNRGAWRFEAAPHDAGLDLGAYCLGGTAGDVDNDGDADLVLACLGRDRLLKNDGGGRFTDVTESSGLLDTFEFGAAAALFDADRDGWLDLFVSRYVAWTADTDLFCSLDGKTKTYCTPQTYPGVSPRFYRNRGDGTFEDRTVAAGVAAPDSKALGLAVLDIEGDGWPDVAVAGDTQPNLLYRNRGDGTFEDIASESGMAYSDGGTARGGMGIDAADYNRSGRASLVISYFASEMVGLYRNQGHRFFVDVAPRSEVGRNTLLTLGWATFFFDYDLDGWLDLFVANGHLDPEAEDLQARVTYAQPQQLFRNLGSGELKEVTAVAGADLAEPRVARGAAFGDLDDDGDLDLVVGTNGGRARLFENRGPRLGHWLRVSLVGDVSNRDGLGATIEVTAGGVTQRRLVRTGGSYLSQSQVDPTFGLGDVERVDRLVVHWPSGIEQTLTDLMVDRRLTVREETTP